MESINVYIGYDSMESIAYHVAVQSIMDNTSYPNIKITPLNTDVLRKAGVYNRSRDEKQSTEFSFTRFLVPYLTNYSGRAIFVDCDVLFRSDILDLWELTSPFQADVTRSVYVVKHEYTPTTEKKHLGNVQYKYACKNWSSLMVFNCNYYDSQKLTPAYVNTASGLELHQFKWTLDERIGELPKEWNWLVGEYDFNQDAKMVHYTIGGPWFDTYQTCDYADEWYKAYERATHVDNSKGN